MWKGKGILIPILTFFILILTELITEWISGDDRFYQKNIWIPSMALFISGLFIEFLTTSWEDYYKKHPDEEISKNVNDSFLFIPVNYWGFILVILSVLFPFIG